MRPVFLVLLSVQLGCVLEEPYAYRPDQASVLVDGMPGARQPIPPERPQGDVRVASLGVTEIEPAMGAPTPVLHVRMVVANNGDDVAWQLEPRAQEVVVPGEGRSGPLFVNGAAQAGESIRVPPREQRTIDFYFPLPATIDSADQLPRFDFLWQVRMASRLVTERTEFHREAVEHEPENVTVVAGWGPWWWFDPAFAGPAFVHPRIVVIHRHHHHDRPPRVRVVRPHRVYVGHPVRPRH
jgi:hypothetical protein